MLMSKKKIKLAIFDVNQTIFNFNEIKSRFKKENINPLLVDQWFINILKEGFASSTASDFLSFTEIAKTNALGRKSSGSSPTTRTQRASGRANH